MRLKWRTIIILLDIAKYHKDWRMGYPLAALSSKAKLLAPLENKLAIRCYISSCFKMLGGEIILLSILIIPNTDMFSKMTTNVVTIC